MAPRRELKLPVPVEYVNLQMQQGLGNRLMVGYGHSVEEAKANTALPPPDEETLAMIARHDEAVSAQNVKQPSKVKSEVVLTKMGKKRREAIELFNTTDLSAYAIALKIDIRPQLLYEWIQKGAQGLRKRYIDVFVASRRSGYL